MEEVGVDGRVRKYVGENKRGFVVVVRWVVGEMDGEWGKWGG